MCCKVKFLEIYDLRMVKEISVSFFVAETSFTVQPFEITFSTAPKIWYGAGLPKQKQKFRKNNITPEFKQKQKTKHCSFKKCLASPKNGERSRKNQNLLLREL